MRTLTINEQLEACQKHAQRNGIQYPQIEVYPNRKDPNHEVIFSYPSPDGQGVCYYSVAVLINVKNNTFANGSRSLGIDNR